MKNRAKDIEAVMITMGNKEESKHLMRFFKCGPGEYGDGDRFLGIRVPATRAVVKEWHSKVDLEDAVELVKSQWHEVRLAGFLLMIELYKKVKKARDYRAIENIISVYLDHIQYGNNWDLVDLVAPKLLGDYLVDSPDRKILETLAGRDDSLWHQRVAMVATWTLICKGQYDDTLRISEKYLDHTHDLIHKASGWMLREVGKRGGLEELKRFLDRHAPAMPRTALRYAIERFTEEERQYYMKLK